MTELSKKQRAWLEFTFNIFNWKEHTKDLTTAMSREQKRKCFQGE